MSGEIGREAAIPLLPRGTLLFESLPAAAVVLDALPQAVGDGVITVRDGARAGFIVVRDGAIGEITCLEARARHSGHSAMDRIKSWNASTVSASKLNADQVALVSLLLSLEPCYENLRLEWTDWPGLIADLCARDEPFAIELTTPNGRGVTMIQGGECVAGYLETDLQIGHPGALDELARDGVGSIRVHRRPAPEQQPTSPPLAGSAASPPPPRLEEQVVRATDAGGGSDFASMFGVDEGPEPLLTLVDSSHGGPNSELDELFAELRLLVRSRLRRSSNRVEEVMDTAMETRRSVAWVAEQVRALSIRGVMRSSLERMADDMLALAARREG